MEGNDAPRRHRRIAALAALAKLDTHVMRDGSPRTAGRLSPP